MGKANKRRLRGLQRRQRQRRGIQLRKRISQPKITTTVAGYCEEKGGRSVGPTNALVFQQRFSRQRYVYAPRQVFCKQIPLQTVIY